MTDERLAQLTQWFNDRPVFRALGASCELLEPGTSHGALRVSSDFDNPNGAVPGTTLASFVDIVGGMAVWTVSTSSEWFATLHLGINYLRPAFGTEFTGRSDVVRRGRGHTWVRIDVFDDQQRLCVAAEGTWAMMALPPGTPEPTPAI